MRTFLRPARASPAGSAIDRCWRDRVRRTPGNSLQMRRQGRGSLVPLRARSERPAEGTIARPSRGAARPSRFLVETRRRILTVGRRTGTQLDSRLRTARHPVSPGRAIPLDAQSAQGWPEFPAVGAGPTRSRPSGGPGLGRAAPGGRGGRPAGSGSVGAIAGAGNRPICLTSSRGCPLASSIHPPLSAPAPPEALRDQHGPSCPGSGGRETHFADELLGSLAEAGESLHGQVDRHGRHGVAPRGRGSHHTDLPSSFYGSPAIGGPSVVSLRPRSVPGFPARNGARSSGRDGRRCGQEPGPRWLGAAVPAPSRARAEPRRPSEPPSARAMIRPMRARLRQPGRAASGRTGRTVSGWKVQPTSGGVLM